MRTSVTTLNPCPPNVARPGYLTPKQAADYTSLSVDYLERLRRTGEGPTPIKIGHRTVRYRVEASRTKERLSGQSLRR